MGFEVYSAILDSIVAIRFLSILRLINKVQRYQKKKKKKPRALIVLHKHTLTFHLYNARVAQMVPELHEPSRELLTVS